MKWYSAYTMGWFIAYTKVNTCCYANNLRIVIEAHIAIGTFSPLLFTEVDKQQPFISSCMEKL